MGGALARSRGINITGGGGGLPVVNVPLVAYSAASVASPITGSMANGSNLLNLNDGSGISVGDWLIVEIGGEAGGGMRGTTGVGGFYPAQTSDPNLYYTNVNVPKSLIARVTGKNSTNQCVMSATAQIATTNARIYRDNIPIWEGQSPPVNDNYPAVAGHAANVRFPSGRLAFSRRVDFTNNSDMELSATSQSGTEIYSPKGTDGAFIYQQNSHRTVMHTFSVTANCGLNGYGLTPQYTNNQAPGTLYEDCQDNEAYAITVTNPFQKAVGLNRCKRWYVHDVDCVMTEPLAIYVQWAFQDADGSGDGLSSGGRWLRCTMTSPWMIGSFESFRTRGTIFQECGGTNAGLSFNTSGEWLSQDCYSHLTANSQFNDNSWYRYQAIHQCNSFIGSGFNTLGGTMNGFTTTQAGYFNAENDILNGLNIQPENVDVHVTGGSFTSPNYAAPSGAQGALAIICGATGFIVDGMTVTGTPNPGGYNFNLYITAGEIRNCTANRMGGHINGGGNVGTFVNV